MNLKLIVMKNFPLSAEFDPDLLYHDPDSWSEQEYRAAKSEHIAKLANAIANERASLRDAYIAYYRNRMSSESGNSLPSAIIVADNLEAAQNFALSLSFVSPNQEQGLKNTVLCMYDTYTPLEAATEIFPLFERILHNASCALVPTPNAIALIELSNRYIYTLD